MEERYLINWFLWPDKEYLYWSIYTENEILCQLEPLTLSLTIEMNIFFQIKLNSGVEIID